MHKKHNRFRANMSREQFDQLQGTEIKSKRTRFGKVFALGANRFQAVTYTDPVHRFNEKTREWDEMDNRFSATPRMKEAKAAWKQGIMPAVAHGDVLLECKTGSMDVACAMSGEAPFINLTDAKGHHLAWGIKDAMSILPEADDIKDTPAQNVRGMREKVLDHLHGEVAYKGIFAGVDLRCKLDRGFKDELVFAEKESVRPITFLLESEGRQMELNEQNMLVVKDEQGEAVFRLQAPFMLDADEQRGDVAVQLTVRDNGVHALTYVPDNLFIEQAAFPVVLDPAIESVRGEIGIEDTYVMEDSTTINNTADQVWVCNNTTYGKRYGYMRVVDLPKIGANDFITGAYLNIRNAAACTADTQVMCSEVLQDWQADNITFATQPDTNPLYQDYCTFPAENTNYTWLNYVWRELDVTALARKWYKGVNYGVVLTPRDTYPNTVRIHSSDGSQKPYFVVNYASLAGLESYLTYDTQSAGLAGSGSVSLVNGNLIFAHNDTSMNGNLMPVSITHYYNSCDADKNEFGLGYGWRTNMHQTLHMEQINGEEIYVYTDGDGTEHFFELDEDAENEQYLDMSGLGLTLTRVVDADTAVETITICDKSDSKMGFVFTPEELAADGDVSAKHLVCSITDTNNNSITVQSDSAHPLRISSVTDGANRTTHFSYDIQVNEEYMCDAIWTSWQTKSTGIRFGYDANCNLTSITHEDNRASHYVYVNVGDFYLLKSAYGDDGFAVNYAYTNIDRPHGGLPHCVVYAESGEQALLWAEDKTSPDEEPVTNKLYASASHYHHGNHLTIVTDALSKKSIRYHFNDNGNCVSVDDELGYAAFTRYDQTDENADTPINHATLRSRMQHVVKNLLMDSSFEHNSSLWEKSSTGNFERKVGDYQWGMVCQRIEAYQNTAYIRQAVTLQPGSSYTLSGYLKSQVKAFLRITYTINGSEYTVDSDAVPASSTATDEDFTRVAVSFTLPADADSQVYCSAMSSADATAEGYSNYGYTWIDCLQLEEGLTCNHYNMLENTDFIRKEWDGTTPESWSIGEYDSSYISGYSLADTEDSISDAPQFLKNNEAVRLLGRYDRTITLYQDVRCSGVEGDRFSLGGWCKSLAKKEDIENYTYCRITAAFSANDPTGDSVTPDVGGAVYFNAGEEGWQFSCASIEAPCRFNYIRVTVQMNRQMNHADFTGLYLYPESFGTDYVYDAKGNRTSAKQLFGGISTAEYDDADNLTKYTAPGHTKSSTFGYGADADEQKKHLLRSSCSPLGTEGQFSYDARGNAKRSDTTDGLSLITRSTSTYQHNDNYVRTKTDARGKTVTTEVDADKGITTKVIDPKDQAVEYTHDTLRRVTEVVTQADGRSYRNNYVYDSNRGLLTSVKHNVDDNTDNDVVYSFEYDALGRKTKVKVGDTTLSENVYQTVPSAAHYGTLSMMKYGNDTVVRNEYDEFNRVIGVTYGSQSENSDEITFESQPRYAYDYNANGQVAHVTNAELNYVTESEYDLSNRPCRIKTHKVTTGTDGKLVSDHIYTGEVAYEKDCGRLSEFREQVGSTHTAYTTSFGYDEENRPTSLNYGSYGTSTLEYDGLGRVKKETVKVGNGSDDSKNEVAYTYVAGVELPKEIPTLAEGEDDPDKLEEFEANTNASGKISTTGLVESITQTGGSFTYTYDDNGNISSVVQDSVTTSYAYDALGQLIRVVDGQEGATWEYEYDQGGNILSKKKFVDNELDESMTFGYVHEGSSLDDEQVRENKWRDLLKYVNGQRITYDKIGNPLNDGTWTYTWQNGRQLQKMQKSGETVEFVYNENGLRVQKTATSTGVTKYTLHGKNIVHMTQGSNELHFFYDAQNKPAVVVYNGTPYSYVKNLQGDIVAILDSNKNVVVSYVYDAWGRPVSCSGTMANTLGKINPFRYRGYVYDEETGLYYLRSRYYCASHCRFVNVDDVSNMVFRRVERNVFAYSANEPVMRTDHEGYESEDMSVWGGFMDVFGAFHITGGVGFGLRLSAEANLGSVPISISGGEKIDVMAVDWGDGEIQFGGSMASGVDVGIGEFFSVGGGESVFHPYTNTEGCTCASLTFDDMLDCPVANASSGISGQIGIGIEAYALVGFNVGGYVDVMQIDRGLKKIINGIADWFGNLF